MNRLLLTFFILIFLHTNLNAQWEILNVGIPGSYENIDFVNENTGWIIAGWGKVIGTD